MANTGNRKRTRRKRTKHVVWICDQAPCGASNVRKIRLGYLIFDDVCDKCKHRIHEPLVEDIKS